MKSDSDTIPAKPFMEIQAASVGKAALDQMETVQNGRVAGVTSAGVFVQAESEIVTFLSTAVGHGPLSIYLGRSCPPLLNSRIGAPVSLGNRRIEFPEIGVVIAAVTAGWHPDSIPGPESPAPVRRARLEFLARKVLEGREIRGLGNLLPALTGKSSREGLSSTEAVLLEKAVAIQTCLAERDLEPLPDYLIPFLGLGPGLTPSGDDLIIGILLYMNRWNRAEWQPSLLEALARKVCAEARKRTTSISASLIECASNGEADERLVWAADHLACGQPDLNTTVHGLLSWGASSGVDTLTGMAVVVG